MELRSTRSEGIAIIRVDAGRIDAAAAIRFKDAMRTLTKDGPDHVVLDMAQVEFVDSSGLGAIVAAMKQLGPRQRLDLAALRPEVDRVFRLTRMDRVFTIHASANDPGSPAAG